MERDSGERNRISLRIFGTRGQHQIQLAGTDFGILKKGLIKIPHAHEKNTVRVLFLEHFYLLHRRGESFCRCHDAILYAFER